MKFLWVKDLREMQDIPIAYGIRPTTKIVGSIFIENDRNGGVYFQ
jgi:hypothetical protein